jgi:uncharacterized protein (DUF4415 family)
MMAVLSGMRKKHIMTTSNNLTAERIAEIKAFKTTDFTDCPIQTARELAEFKPKHPENFRALQRTIELTLDDDVFNWVQSMGYAYQSHINSVLRAEMRHAV